MREEGFFKGMPYCRVCAGENVSPLKILLQRKPLKAIRGAACVCCSNLWHSESAALMKTEVRRCFVH